MLKPFDRPKAINRVITICRRAVSPLGYEGTGRTWKLINETSARVINLQTSTNDVGAQLTFTFNLGVFFPEIYEARHGTLPLPPIQESHCCPRERIGLLFSDYDRWWKVDRDTEQSDLEMEVTALLVRKAIPWLSQFNSVQSIFEDACRRGRYFDAAIAAYAGQRDDVALWIQKALAIAPHDLATRVINIWARDHRIQGFAD